MDLLVVSCFAIPIVATAKTIIEDNRFMAKKREAKTWKMRDGSVVDLTKMSDSHLANAIRMVARNCHNRAYRGDMKEDKSFLKLVSEGRRRKFQITILNSPSNRDGRIEYVDVFIPKLFPTMKIAASILPSDWDSRPQD